MRTLIVRFAQFLLALTPSLALAQTPFATYSTLGTWTTFNTSNGMYTGTIPGGVSQYDAVLTMPANGVGTGKVFFQANAAAVASIEASSTGTPTAGSAYVYTNMAGGMTLYKVVNGVSTTLASGQVGGNGSTTVTHVVSRANGTILIYYELAGSNEPFVVLSYSDSSPLAGTAGFGLYNGNSTAGFSLYPLNSSGTIDPFTIQSYPQPNRIDFHLAGNQDGVIVASYAWYRNGTFLFTENTPNFSDVSVLPSTTYSYSVVPMTTSAITLDTITVSVTTPPAGAVDNRKIGTTTTGSYWGGMGEQIDVRSGNLNFSYPLVTANGRTFSVPLSLSYNSQNWRKDSAGNVWQLAESTQGGYGWTLQVGSIQAFYSNAVTIHHYLFTDATGASYILDQNNGGVWSSTQSAYVWYTASTGILHFSNGTFWTFGSTSAPTESDAGALYPTVIEDSNGNQVNLTYDDGLGMTTANTSGRIRFVSDARSTSSTGPTYTINYMPNAYGSSYSAPVLANLSNSVGSGEAFGFGAQFGPGGSVGVVLNSPFGTTDFGLVNVLNSVTNQNTGLTTTFSYDPSGSGELDQVTFPYGGHIRWVYGNQTLANNATLREVTGRYLQWDSTIGERTFTLTRDSGDGSRFVPLNRTVTDSHSNATKVWTFNQIANASQGLVTSYSEQQTGPALTYRLTNYTWTQDSAGNNYIGQVQKISDPGQTYAVTNQTSQTLDQYGNVLQTNLYSFTNLTTPAKTYTNTYLNSSAYLSAYIFNRLVSSTLTNGTTTYTLVTNTYDTGTLANATPITQHDANYGTSVSTRGNVTQTVSFTNSTTSSYDITGTVTNQTTNGVSTSVTTGSATNYAAPTSITTANSLTTTMNWNSFLAPTSATGPTGASLTNAYDPSTARPSSTTSPYGATTSYAYSNTAPQVTATIDGRWTATYYDGLGRQYRLAAGNGSTTLSYADTVYDTCGCTPLGKPWKTSTPYAPGGTPVYTATTYDAIGRTVSTVSPDGASTTSYSYQGNVITVTDAAGKWKQYTMDSFGELTQVVEPSPNPGTEPNHVTSYAYDLLGHMTQVSMPRTVAGSVVTQTRTWTYSPTTTLLTSKTSPEAGTVSYTYNSNGTLATVTDAKSQQKKYTYDAYNRVTQIARGTISGSTFTEILNQRTTYVYDSSATCSAVNANTLGSVAEIDYTIIRNTKAPTNPTFAATECYAYHSAGAVTAKQVTLSNPAYTQSNLMANYSYDSEGRVSTVGFTTGGNRFADNVSYAYDTMGRLNTMTDTTASTSLVSATAYNLGNQITSLTANSFSESRTYNPNLQLTQLRSGGYSFNYNYSTTQNNGRIQSMNDVISGEAVTYQYDSLNRLINATGTGDAHGAWSQGFTYDGFGNLTQKNGTNAPNNLNITMNAATNQLTGNGAIYDSNGNLTQYGSPVQNSFTYDIENRTATVTSGISSPSQYGYDSSNQRIYSGVYSSTLAETFFFYGSSGQKLLTYTLGGTNGAPQVIRQNFWFGGRLLTTLDRLSSNGKYFPFGEDRTSPSPANPANGVEKFGTYTRDAESGLDYAYQRYYASGVARFLTPDPADGSGDPKTPQSLNRYPYVLGDPINFGDPTGAFYDYIYADGDGGYSNGPCGPDWIWDASLSGPCRYGPVFIGAFLGSFGGGGGTTQPPASNTPQFSLKFNYGLFLSPCLGQFGGFARLTYQIINDGTGQPVPAGSQVQEKVANVKYNGVWDTSNVWPQQWVTPDAISGSAFTNSNGQFLDQPFGACGPRYPTSTYFQQDQAYRILFQGSWYPIQPSLTVDIYPQLFGIRYITSQGVDQVISLATKLSIPRNVTPF